MIQELAPIQIYTSPNGKIAIEVLLEKETVRLSQQQISDLFWRDRSVISKHILAIFKEGELERHSNVQKMHITWAYKPTELYNLDVIISVGYRIKSHEWVKFRQRATSVLKQYLVQGYNLNQPRLQQTGIQQVHRALELIRETLANKSDISPEETQGLLDVITRYTQSRLLLYQYDQWELPTKWNTIIPIHKLQATQAVNALEQLKTTLLDQWTASDLFALPKYAGSIEGIFGNIYQSFDGKELYPSVEEKSAHLLYFIIKDHPFNDGNKRSAAFLFIVFLQQYGILHDKEGNIKINDKGLVALALLIAQSDPRDKELMIQLVINLINE